MNNLYRKFSSNEKISVIQSMYFLTAKFLDSYKWDLTLYQNDELLINDLYFYWLRTSAIKKYTWCKEYEDFLLSNEFADEMKKILKRVLFRTLIIKRDFQSEYQKELCFTS